VEPGHERSPFRFSASPGGPAPTQVTIAPRTLVLFVLLVGGVVVLGDLALAARTILVQLVVAVVLAMALEPLVHALEARGLRRGAAVAITFTCVAIAVAAFAYLLFAPLVREFDRFANDLPTLLRDLTHGRGRLGFLERRFHVVERARAEVKAHGAAGVGGMTVGVVGSVVKTGGAVVLVAFLTLFVQLGGRQWFEALVALVPESSRGRVRRAGAGVSTAVGGYVAGNLLISVIAGTVTTLVLLATGVPYAVPLGVMVAIFDLIPLVGATIGTVIVAAVALTKGVTTTAIVVGAMMLYQEIENHTLQQVVYHRTVQLSPLAISVSVAAGAEIGGIVGALLGIPFAGALKVIFGELAAWRRGEDAPA
jgi:predicted PurR-regulated permease PerM